MESYSPLEKLIKYYGDSKTPGATFPFNFLMLLEVNRDTNATAWADSINSYYKAIGNHWPNWVVRKVYIFLKKLTNTFTCAAFSW